jgi:hypothetical protein
MRHLRPIADFHPRHTLTACAGHAANRRPMCDGNFACGKTGFFRGDEVAVPFLENIPYISYRPRIDLIFNYLDQTIAMI